MHLNVYDVSKIIAVIIFVNTQMVPTLDNGSLFRFGSLIFSTRSMTKSMFPCHGNSCFQWQDGNFMPQIQIQPFLQEYMFPFSGKVLWGHCVDTRSAHYYRLGCCFWAFIEAQGVHILEKVCHSLILVLSIQIQDYSVFA